MKELRLNRLVTKSNAKLLEYCRLFFVLSASLIAPAVFSQSSDIDPYMEFNRNIYQFNKSLDNVLFKPVTLSYDKYMPEYAKRGVSNFFNNLDDINVVANDLLQLKMKNALQDSGRLVINSTIGFVGLFDVASEFGLYKNTEDFGQTLGYWGVPTGPYLVLPLVGTTNVRDAIGLIPDYLLNPVFWISDDEARFVLYAMDNTDTRLYYLAAESMISGDEYTFVRDAYIQRREYLVADGEVFDEWDDY